eukprot:CAMPEP_0197589576 /NCGR_PEP_ID=MMETSP1326-20131121/10482_1 /TAXON_ID=1155430 /ORGANISM="Genus nov. species nov., Strain RCC2288" /LENGTH=38 /DNA_ID= /DNA_START= /DNA_END= /DNA_ORIENTATION=
MTGRAVAVLDQMTTPESDMTQRLCDILSALPADDDDDL